MRPEPIDSTKKLISPPEIMMEFLKRYDDTGYPIQVSMLALAQELGMDDAEAIQFGNTAFISHYSDDKRSVYMSALNVDTASNYVDNVENYVAHVFRRGVKQIVTNFSDPSIESVIKTVKKRIDKFNPELEADLSIEQDGEETVAIIDLRSE